MSRVGDLKATYRHQLVRAVLGERPAECSRVHDAAEVARIAKHLADCEEACAILRAKGWGDFGKSLIDAVKAVPVRTVT